MNSKQLLQGMSGCCKTGPKYTVPVRHAPAVLANVNTTLCQPFKVLLDAHHCASSKISQHC